jgi:hypothetical protein
LGSAGCTIDPLERPRAPILPSKRSSDRTRERDDAAENDGTTAALATVDRKLAAIDERFGSNLSAGADDASISVS